MEITQNGQTVRYRYDPMGRRISKSSSSTGSGTTATSTYYLYGDTGLMAEADAQGVITKAYGWNPESAQAGLWSTDPIWQAQVGSNSLTNAATRYDYLHTDHLGTPILATTKEGSTSWRGVSEAFGATATTVNAIEMNLRLPGQYWDEETQSHYNFHRDYRPELGRYGESDPIGLDGGINKFLYASGDPISYVDPDGQVAWGLIFGVADIGLQLYDHGGNWRCINLGEVGLSLIGGGLAGGLEKGAFRFKSFGSHTWDATRKWMNKERIQLLKPGQQRHHWLLERNQGWGKRFADRIKNQPWNTNPIPAPFNNWLGRNPSLAWLGAPGWAGSLTVGGLLGGAGLAAGDDCECNR